LHTVLTSRHDGVGSELVADQQEVSIVTRASTKDRLLVTARAEREVELRPQALFTGKSVQGDCSASFKRRDLFGRRGGQGRTKLAKNVVGDRHDRF
jgi:hypothetical protein